MPDVLRQESKWDGHAELAIVEPPILFAFDRDKAHEMLKYLLKAVGGAYNYMALLKLVFFADRYHVRTYGRPVSSDDYFAMKLGPVPSNLLREVKSIVGTGYDLRLSEAATVDESEFSRSDREAMDFAVDSFGDIGREDPFRLAELTHAYPEWDRWRERFEKDPDGRENIDYCDFLKDADPNHHVFVRLGFPDPYPVLPEDQREFIIWQMREVSI
ncbi:MAG: SocA family protein [Bacteroidetes bacterium]|nr:SocA family protein [Bacteroidota bacterium]